MGQERMSGLAFMHINHDVGIDEDEVINIFWQNKRAVEFFNICSQDVLYDVFICIFSFVRRSIYLLDSYGYWIRSHFTEYDNIF